MSESGNPEADDMALLLQLTLEARDLAARRAACDQSHARETVEKHLVDIEARIARLQRRIRHRRGRTGTVTRGGPYLQAPRG